MQLENKLMMVTGASSGIGAATANLAAQSGAGG
jgi:NADP-dependent 3-hydroxy acid dehydrogenase YdfG